jgi:predicted Zn-dependent protease
VHYTYQAGYDPRGMASLFQDLLQERTRRPTRVEQFFASHPLTEQRIQTVQAEASQLPRKASLTHDTRNYQSFRSEFR